MAPEEVAALYNLKFDKRDRAKMKSSICNRIQAREHYREVVSSLVDKDTPVKARPQNIGKTIIDNRTGKRRRSSPTNDDKLPSKKSQKTFHGARKLRQVSRSLQG